MKVYQDHKIIAESYSEGLTEITNEYAKQLKLIGYSWEEIAEKEVELISAYRDNRISCADTGLSLYYYWTTDKEDYLFMVVDKEIPQPDY